jgi:hypothetical protein
VSLDFWRKKSVWEFILYPPAVLLATMKQCVLFGSDLRSIDSSGPQERKREACHGVVLFDVTGARYSSWHVTGAFDGPTI